jgi:hypothetical protein
VGIANAFDQLPKEAVPEEVDLPQSVSDARAACKRLFKKLPRSIERKAMLNALGRLGKAALKHLLRRKLMPVQARCLS